MNTDFPLKAQDAIIGDVIIYPEMDMSRTVSPSSLFQDKKKFKKYGKFYSYKNTEKKYE